VRPPECEPVSGNILDFLEGSVEAARVGVSGVLGITFCFLVTGAPGVVSMLLLPALACGV
jgi:hypothetical protein